MNDQNNLTNLINEIEKYSDLINLDSYPQGGVGAMLPIASECKQSENKAQKIKKELNNRLFTTKKSTVGEYLKWVKSLKLNIKS